VTRQRLLDAAVVVGVVLIGVGLVIDLVTIADGNLARIQLLPIDLQFDGDGEQRGRPKLASAELAERIVADVAAKSKQLGAQIRYDRRSNRGEVVLEA